VTSEGHPARTSKVLLYMWALEVCGSTRTRGYTRPDPYPRVWAG